MAIRTDDEAKTAINRLLAKPVDNPGPTWLEVVDLCLWANKQLLSPDTRAKPITKPSRTEYFRSYKRDWRLGLRRRHK